MEKTLRVLGGDEEGGAHSHSHSHSHSPARDDTGNASGVHVSPSSDGLKNRKAEGKASTIDSTSAEDQVHENAGPQPSKLSAYLNLFGDFVHNMCVIFRPTALQLFCLIPVLTPNHVSLL